MSVPVHFKVYNSLGIFLGNRSFFTVSYGSNPNDLNMLHRRWLEGSVEYYQKFIHPDVRYFVPLRCLDWMFDIEDPTKLLPNKFKGDS